MHQLALHQQNFWAFSES